MKILLVKLIFIFSAFTQAPPTTPFYFDETPQLYYEVTYQTSTSEVGQGNGSWMIFVFALILFIKMKYILVFHEIKIKLIFIHIILDKCVFYIH